MNGDYSKNISNFYVAGINYRKADAVIRGQYAVNNPQCYSIYRNATTHQLNELFILSTCNRTEIYGFAKNPAQLIELLCTETTAPAETFHEYCYIKRGPEAIDHLYMVAAGLDSQLLGDYEIVGQLKTAVKFAKEQGCTGSFTERLVNSVLQSSKNIKNNTALSSGTVSVSFAAIQYILENVKQVTDKKILLVGIGKLGRNTSKNLADHLGTKNITLVNRTVIKAAALAKELNVGFAPEEELKGQVQLSDIIIVATSAPSPLIVPSQVKGYGEKLIIDLSIPCNVDPAVRELPGIQLINVDQLAKRKDETLQKREADIPKAKAIIAEHIKEFNEWYEMRRNAPVLKAVKIKLRELYYGPLFIPSPKHNPTAPGTDEKIQRVINSMALKMKTDRQKGCHYIEAINEFITTGSHELT